MSTDSINPNVSMTETQATTNGKIELNAASGPVSFDELEQVEASAKAKARAEKKEAKEKSLDLSSNKTKAEVKETKEEKVPAKTEKKSDETKQEKENEANLEKARKIVKAKFNDSELDLDEEAMVPVKINGKEEMVQIKELLGNYSGKVAWDKKFTEISKRDKEIKTLELRGKQAIESFKSAMEEKDPTLRMFKMAQMAGVDPITYRQNFLDDNINLLEKYYAMSDDERKADALAYEAQFHKHRADTLESSTKQQQTQREQQAKLEQLRASHQIPEDVYLSFQDQAEQAIKDGALDQSFLQPEKIIELVQKDKIWNAVESVLDQVNLPWSEQDKGKKILKLVDDSYQMGFKPEQVAEFVIETYGGNKPQKRVEQLKQERQEFLSGKKDVQQTSARKEEPLFFDQM